MDIGDVVQRAHPAHRNVLASSAGNNNERIEPLPLTDKENPSLLENRFV